MTTRNAGTMGAVFGWVLALALAPSVAAAQADPSRAMYGGPPPPELATSVPAPAPARRYPSSYTERPLTLPALHLRVDADLSITRANFFGEVTLVSLAGGLGFGVTDNLEFGLGTSPIAPVLAAGRYLGAQRGLGGLLRPSSARGLTSPTLYGRLRLVETPALEMGLELAVVVPTQDSDTGVLVGLPLRVRAGDSFALDAAFGVLVIIWDPSFGGRETQTTLSLSLMPRYALERFYVGLDTGFTLFVDNPDTAAIPLAFEAGATLPMGEGTLDVYARGGFPALFLPGASGDRVLTDFWELSFGVRLHVGLGRR